METFKLVVKEPSHEELTYLENSINNFNIDLTGIPFGGELAVLVYSKDDQLVGGVNGFQWGDAFSVIYLWIEKEWRGQDIGTQVLRMIEDQAAERGCTQVYLDTYNFQAIDFYQKLGYEVVGTLENFPTPLYALLPEEKFVKGLDTFHHRPYTTADLAGAVSFT